MSETPFFHQFLVERDVEKPFDDEEDKENKTHFSTNTAGLKQAERKKKEKYKAHSRNYIISLSTSLFIYTLWESPRGTHTLHRNLHPHLSDHTDQSDYPRKP